MKVGVSDIEMARVCAVVKEFEHDKPGACRKWINGWLSQRAAMFLRDLGFVVAIDNNNNWHVTLTDQVKTVKLFIIHP